MTKTITISGWGQAVDSLECVAPGAEHIAYAQHQSVQDALDALKGKSCEILIGWSQGGQLALRAVCDGVLKPKKLILLAAPFQFVEGEGMNCGMHEEQFLAFKYAFLADPERTLKRFSIMVAHNDSCKSQVLGSLQPDINNVKKWDFWLDQLEQFSCKEVDFTKMPEKTLLIHGVDDVVVEATQTSVFLAFMPHAELEMFDKCGHAPHLHDAARVRELITAL